MINFKSTLIAGSGALLVMAWLFTVQSARAQSQNLSVTVPFDFYAGDLRLSAGDYQAAPVSANFVRLYNPATRESVAFATVSLSTVLGKPSSPKLVFNKYGADHFLSEMWWGLGNQGIAPIPSKLETELAKSFRRVRIEAQARRP